VLVGDVIGVSCLATRLSTSSTGLQVKLLATSLQPVNTGLFGPALKINMNGCPHASAKVGWAGVDVAILLIQTEVLSRLLLDGLLDSLNTLGKPGEDLLHISSLLHGDDAELILLVDPDKEGLLCVVEDSTTLGPVTLHTSNSQVAVSRDEEEVVINQLLADSLIHASERIVLASEVAGQLGQSGGHHLLDVNSLLLGDSGGKTESINITSDTNTGGVDWDSGLDVADDLLGVHVGGVLGIGGDTVVVLDDGIEDLGEVLVGVPITSVDTAVLVVELDGTGAGLGDGEAAGLGLDVLDLVPSLLGHVLGHQGVGGLDDGEFSRHDS